MTPQRAQYLLDNRLIGGDLKVAYYREYCYQGGIQHHDGITKEEDAQIREMWNTMDGNTCYMHALIRIAQGFTHPLPSDVEMALMRGELE